MKVTLYTKPGCELCEEVEAMLERLRPVIRFDAEFVNIESDSAIYERFWDRIPVVFRDGVEIAAAPIDEQRLRTALSS